LIKQVMSTGQPLYIADSSTGDVSSSSLKGLTLRSIICAPLLFGDPTAPTVGGILYLDSRALVRTFQPEHVQLVSAIAAHGVAALQLQQELFKLRGMAGQDAGKLAENFERLLEVGRSISSTLVLDDLLELVIEKVLEITRADRGFLMLIEEGKPDPVFKIGLNWNKKDGPARRKRKLKEEQFFFSRTVCNKALESKQSVVLQDAQAGGGMDASVSIVQMDLHSVMVTPLVEKGEVLGLIYVDSKMSNKAFADSDVQLFEALAGQAAIGLKNALLYSQVAAQQRIESEIAIASALQQDLCPKTVPEIQGIDIVGFMEPAREVGGDYYDYVEDPHAPGQILGIVVGDVSGKGLGAGMVAVMARCFLRPMCGAYSMDDPSQLLSYLNATLVPELKPGKFMTMLLMVYDAGTSSVRYASSGHENIIVWRAATRQAETIQSGGSPLGISVTTGGPTPNVDMTLAAGDTLVLYTDGVTEAMNETDDEFTLEALVDLVNQVGGQPAEAIKQAIMNAVVAHRRTREQTDDITLVILRRV
jgi:serine phosphatase RsbU (regulator of sigma subunit)